MARGIDSDEEDCALLLVNLTNAKRSEIPEEKEISLVASPSKGAGKRYR
jgi:hypothetical protein